MIYLVVEWTEGGVDMVESWVDESAAYGLPTRSIVQFGGDVFQSAHVRSRTHADEQRSVVRTAPQSVSRS